MITYNHMKRPGPALKIGQSLFGNGLLVRVIVVVVIFIVVLV